VFTSEDYGDGFAEKRTAILLAARAGIDRSTDVVEGEVTVGTIKFDHKKVDELLIDTSAYAAYPAVLDENFVMTLKHTGAPGMIGDTENTSMQTFGWYQNGAITNISIQYINPSFL
jgi:hypothetical protein